MLGGSIGALASWGVQSGYLRFGRIADAVVRDNSADYETTINAHLETIAELNASVDTISAQINGLYEQTATLTASNVAHVQTIAGLNAQIGELTAEIERLQDLIPAPAPTQFEYISPLDLTADIVNSNAGIRVVMPFDFPNDGVLAVFADGEMIAGGSGIMISANWGGFNGYYCRYLENGQFTKIDQGLFTNPRSYTIVIEKVFNTNIGVASLCRADGTVLMQSLFTFYPNSMVAISASTINADGVWGDYDWTRATCRIERGVI